MLDDVPRGGGPRPHKTRPSTSTAATTTSTRPSTRLDDSLREERPAGRDQAIILRKVNELALNPGMNVQDGMLTTHSERAWLAPEADLLREFLARPMIPSSAPPRPSANSSAQGGGASRR